MVENPPVGQLVIGTVVAHHRWGVDLRLEPPWQNVLGVVDLIFITDQRPFEPFDDFPKLGAVVNARVVAVTPDGRLRLSMLASDVNSKAERSGDGNLPG